MHLVHTPDVHLKRRLLFRLVRAKRAGKFGLDAALVGDVTRPTGLVFVALFAGIAHVFGIPDCWKKSNVNTGRCRKLVRATLNSFWTFQNRFSRKSVNASRSEECLNLEKLAGVWHRSISGPLLFTSIMRCAIREPMLCPPKQVTKHTQRLFKVRTRETIP